MTFRDRLWQQDKLPRLLLLTNSIQNREKNRLLPIVPEEVIMCTCLCLGVRGTVLSVGNTDGANTLFLAIYFLFF